MQPILYGNALRLPDVLVEPLDDALAFIFRHLSVASLCWGAQIRWNCGQRNRVTRAFRTHGGRSALQASRRRDVLAAASDPITDLLRRHRLLRDQDHATLDIHPAGLIWTFFRFPGDVERRTITVFAAEPTPDRPWLEPTGTEVSAVRLASAFARTTDVLARWMPDPYEDQAVLLRDPSRPPSAHDRLAVAPVLETITPYLRSNHSPLLAVRAGGAFLLAVGGSHGRGPLVPWIPLALAPDPEGFQ